MRNMLVVVDHFKIPNHNVECVKCNERKSDPNYIPITFPNGIIVYCIRGIWHSTIETALKLGLPYDMKIVLQKTECDVINDLENSK
jgi:hypothetical protein